jgi:hypothetical protein
MTQIRMDTDAVQYCAQGLRAQSEQICEQARGLLVCVRSLEWYSPSRDVFEYELEILARRMLHLAEEGQILASCAYRQADVWQEIDLAFVKQFSQIRNLFYVGGSSK